MYAKLGYSVQRRTTLVIVLTSVVLLLATSASFALAVSADSYCFRATGSSILNWGGDAYQSPTGDGSMNVKLTYFAQEIESFPDTSEPWTFRTQTGDVNEGNGAWQVFTNFLGDYGSAADRCDVY